MRVLKSLWTDEVGVILSAEAVVVGTVAVVGLTAGMSVVATSVNEELKDVGFAIRSLDQSYEIPGQQGCGAMTAGSSFKQEPVKESLKELSSVYRDAEKKEKAQAERLEQQLKERRKEEAKKKEQAREKDERDDDDDDEKEESSEPKKRRTDRQI
ncbi:MAG: hypothetical protein JNL58_25735 [Planctomyces sp.]|nr:hypothetical protein [Planctomyces sp.]